MATGDLEIRLSTLVTGVAGFAVVTNAVNDLENALSKAVKTGIDFNLRMEAAQTAFTHLLGSTDAAKAFNDELQRQSILTGRSAAQTAIWAQQMVAAGIAANNVPAILRAIEESAALAGKGTTENINGIVLAITQMAQKGKLSMEEIRQQLAEKGVNAIQLLATHTGKSTAEINADIEAGRLTVNDFLKALISASQNEWSNVLAGRAKTVGGALQILGGVAENTFGKILAPAFEAGGKAIVDLAEKAQSSDFQDTIQRSANVVGAFVEVIEKELVPALGRLGETTGINAGLALKFGNDFVTGADFALRAIGGLVTAGSGLFSHFGVLVGGNAALIGRAFQTIGEAAKAVQEGRFGDLSGIFKRNQEDIALGRSMIATDLEKHRQTVLGGLSDAGNAWNDAGKDYIKRVEAFNKDVSHATNQSTPGFGPNQAAPIDFKKFADDALKWNRAMEDIQRDHNKDLEEHFRRGNEITEDFYRKNADIRRQAMQRLGDANREELEAQEDQARALRELRDDTDDKIGKARSTLAARLADISRDELSRAEDFEQKRVDIRQRSLDALADLEQRFADRRAEIAEDGDNSPRGRIRQEAELKKLARQEARERNSLTGRLKREEEQALAAIARDQKVEAEKTAIARAEAKARADAEIAEAKKAEAEKRQEIAHTETRRLEDHNRELARIKEEADRDIAENRRATDEQIADINRRTKEQVEASQLRLARLIEDNAELFKTEEAIKRQTQEKADAEERIVKAKEAQLRINKEMQPALDAQTAALLAQFPVGAAPPTPPTYLDQLNQRFNIPVGGGGGGSSGFRGPGSGGSPVNIQTINITASNDPAEAINQFVNELERRGVAVSVGNK